MYQWRGMRTYLILVVDHIIGYRYDCSGTDWSPLNERCTWRQWMMETKEARRWNSIVKFVDDHVINNEDGVGICFGRYSKTEDLCLIS